MPVFLKGFGRSEFNVRSVAVRRYILITLVMLFYGSVAATDNKTYILATVLFYSDKNGDKLVASGPVALKLDKVIRRDIKIRLKNAEVKVVPIFKDPRVAPRVEELFGFVKYAYKHIFVLDLPARLAGKIIAGKRKLMKKKNHMVDVRNIKIFTVGPDLQDVGNDMITEIEDKGDGKVDLAELIDSRKENEEKRLEKFLPKSVYYAIENRCANWSNDCDLLQSNFFNMSRRSFKYTFFRYSTEPMSLKQTTSN